VTTEIKERGTMKTKPKQPKSFNEAMNNLLWWARKNNITFAHVHVGGILVIVTRAPQEQARRR